MKLIKRSEIDLLEIYNIRGEEFLIVFISRLGTADETINISEDRSIVTV